MASKLGITPEAFEAAAKALGVEVAAIKAVDEVESRGSGFLPDGRVRILFERHKFHEFTDGIHDAKYPAISNPSAGGYGKAGAAQYLRFNRAFELDPEAAMKSASYGRYQIMGFNHKLVGFKTVGAFVDAMKVSEEEQLKAFVNFVKSQGLAVHLKNHDWAAFAKGYNGVAYKKNRYDRKLADAYSAYSFSVISNDISDLDSATPTPAELPTESPNLVQTGTVSPDSGPPATVAATIPAVPPLPTEVPSGLSRFFKWVGGLSIGSYVGSLAVFKDHPELLGPLLALLKIVFVGLSGVGAVVAVMFFIERIAKARQSNELNQTRLATFADPSLVNVDLKGWKSPQGEVKQ